LVPVEEKTLRTDSPSRRRFPVFDPATLRCDIDRMACAGAARQVSAVLYHYPCPDGAFAALAAHLYFSAAARPVRFFPNTVYDPIR
jgi:hypothetical protein